MVCMFQGYYKVVIAKEESPELYNKTVSSFFLRMSKHDSKDLASAFGRMADHTFIDFVYLFLCCFNRYLFC